MRINPNAPIPVKPNRPVSEAFLKLKHSINSCTNYRQLDLLTSFVRDHAKNHPEEADILVYYMNKDGELSPDLEEDSIESLFHKRNCGSH